ncbi:MAG: prepilin-type N-terminal cleavage/methylation domain-containing protein [Clostridiaceae bacterium]|nr:prepilin-type N-terminal cleavage/methylation domain-containing protein [Clostridiaceae bacterium]
MNSLYNGFRKRLGSRKGMTLMEVLVAMTLLVLIIMVFTPLFMTYFRNLRTAGEITQKTYRRASIMERLIANPDGSNDVGYETSVAAVPITLTAGSTTVDFSLAENAAGYVGNVRGTMVSESINNDDSYVSFYTPSTGSTMVSFPASLTDDFITKDITVVPKGFKFADAALSNKDAATGYHFEVYNTLDTGVKSKVSTAYYDIKAENDGDGGKVAVFTFKGANDVICFERSPLWIQYCGSGGMLYQVKVKIGAPEIILVGEEASDNNYYYYATSGVETEGTNRGKMDIVAKKMSGAPLVSAMNDVEWVAKGKGDDGNGGVNQYGYYVMGGDAGQVRRFWRNETTGNYYWGGDVLGQYDRYYYITGNNTAGGGSYENITQTNTTQAQFKSIFRSKQGEYDYNGVSNANQLTSDELITLGFVYKMISANYYTANVTTPDSTHPYYTTLGRVLSYKSGSDKYIIPGCTTEQPKLSKSWNDLLYCELEPSGYGENLNVNGYIKATNYEYNTANNPDAKINDTSLITITSVGAIQINTNNSNYYQSNQNSVLGQQLYPTQSYTLYCGTIPAVIDTWGWKTANNVVFWLNQNWSKWLHTGTLGVALGQTNNNIKWYPVGKFGDTHTTTSNSDNAVGDLSTTIFGTNPSWTDLLNFGGNESKYPYSNTSTSITIDEITNQVIHHDEVSHLEGKYTHTVAVSGTYNKKKGWFGSETVPFNNEVLTLTVKGQNYNSEGTWTWDQVQTVLANRLPNYENTLNITKIEWSKIDGNDDPYFASGQWGLRAQSSGQGLHDDSANSRWRSVEELYREKVIDQAAYDEEVPEDQWQHNYTTITGNIRYYSPVNDGSGLATKPSDVSGTTLGYKSFMGTALPSNGNDYYVSAGHEVDITMGYLSQPYAIDVNNPTVPKMSGLSGLTGGSDFYFKKPGDGIGSSILSGGAFNHSFVSGGLRDNVTMLDVKSFHDDLTGNNISLAAGYTLSYVANDYSYCTRLGQVLNNGVVYIRATGDGTESDTAGDLSSGKGWSLKKETNVFHQFFGIDQYRGVSIGDGAGTSAVLGWNTTYHKGYLNMSTDSEKSPQPSYSPSITTGNQNYGVNYHPLMDTECTTVNWGTTSDMKPQAMWGTSNGTLMSWFYNYESVKDSKIYSVCKEFENYSWCDKFGIKPTTDTYKKEYYDYTTVSRNIYNDYGFVSVLKNINDVCFCDDVWVAVGDQSGKKPSDYSAPKSYNRLGATGEAGSYVNVKFLDKDLTGSDGLPIARWIAVKISDRTDINIRSVVNCQGVWYLMGYVDENGNGQNDAGERCVMYWSKQPQDGFQRCATRNALTGTDMYSGTADNEKTYAMYFDADGKVKTIDLEGVNKMACQS